MPGHEKWRRRHFRPMEGASPATTQSPASTANTPTRNSNTETRGPRKKSSLHKKKVNMKFHIETSCTPTNIQLASCVESCSKPAWVRCAQHLTTKWGCARPMHEYNATALASVQKKGWWRRTPRPKQHIKAASVGGNRSPDDAPSVAESTRRSGSSSSSSKIVMVNRG